MKHPGRAAFLAVLIIALYGCSTLSPLGLAPSEVQVRQWLAEHRYDKALPVLKRRAQGGHADARATLRRAQTAAAAYDRKTAAAALRRADRQEWAAALHMVDQGLRNYPKGPRLRAARDAVRAHQAKRLQELELQLMLAKGEWLLRSGPIRAQLAHADPDNLDAAWQVQRDQRETRETAEWLLQFGNHALNRHDLELAGRCLHLADRLHPTPRTARALDTLDQQQRQRTERMRARQLNRRTHKLMTEMRQAMTNADLPTARAKLLELTSIDKDNPKLRALDQALNQAIAAKVTELTDKGDALYTAGRITAAKRSWQQGLALDPKNQTLLGRVRRAERVLHKLHKLRQKETGSK